MGASTSPFTLKRTAPVAVAYCYKLLLLFMSLSLLTRVGENLLECVTHPSLQATSASRRLVCLFVVRCFLPPSFMRASRTYVRTYIPVEMLTWVAGWQNTCCSCYTFTVRLLWLVVATAKCMVVKISTVPHVWNGVLKFTVPTDCSFTF